MNDSTFAYPEFKEGQVLTHNDLNLLRDYLYTKSMFHGRALFGFGVACGLDGRIDGGTTLRIAPGFALGQGGRELRLSAEKSFALGGTIATDATAYAFVEGGPGGYTPILRPADTIEAPGGACDENGCTTHTEIHHETADIVLVPGRLRLDPLLATAEVATLFALQPIDPKTNPSLTGFGTLRDALRAALTPYLESATLDYLLPSKLKLEGPPGVDLRKVGLVNEVLYAAWDFFICKTMSTVPCGGVAAPPVAVALGWLSKPGASWTWEPRFRHWFQLSLALYRAVRGFHGQDLCRVYLDHVRVLLESFEVPVIPPSNGGKVKDPPIVDICKYLDVRLGVCPKWPKKRPPELPYTVDLIDPTKWIRKQPIPTGPDDYVPIAIDDGTTWPVDFTLDPADSGLIYVTDLLGTKAGKAGENIETAIEGIGLEPKVGVVTLDEFKDKQKNEGLVPGLVVAASDSIFLAQNDAGAVIATGSIPTAQTLGDVPGIAETAHNAETVALGMDGRIKGIEQGFGDFKVDLQNQFLELTNSLPLDGINIAVGLDEKVNGVLLDLEKTRGTIGALGATINQLDTRTKTLETRGLPGGGGPGGANVTLLNTSLYESLDAMRDAIKAGSTQRAGPKVRQQLAAVDAQFEVLRRESVEGVSLLTAHPEAVAEVVDGIVNAVTAMGLPADSPELRNLTENVAALKGAMGIG
jgi:hypothetical protein